MNHSARSERILKQLALIQNDQHTPLRTIFSLYAQAIIELSLYHWQKERFLKDIDEALEKKNKEMFMTVTTKYNRFLEQYKDGKVLEERGLQWKIKFEE
ncbi:IDEAL domain-containing protein [Alkalihalobacterium bogoriense]|uniref:IDEAL domain-containing protein n=1 Tax=Alkalihalobacterium bogoriense TaxID=246272 RepID=UPI00047CB858|nr:IDEAL domain-containing protein [Alkalihalobacterium bogoriense]